MRTGFGLSLTGALLLFVLAGCTQSMREQNNASLPLSNSPPVDLNGALAQAKAGNKVVLLDFTGSDWCPMCIDLRYKVFSKPEFQAYAASNLVFVTVDFPLNFRLTPEAVATNNFLAERFGVENPPTLIALNGDGKEIWRHLGPIDGGPRDFQDQLQAARKE